MALKGSLIFAEDYALSGRQRESVIGSVSGTGSISSSANQFSGSLDFDGIGNYTGTFSGQFYGPKAQQLGGVFTASDGDNRAAGAFTGQQDASILNAEQTLQGLQSVTTFEAFAKQGIYGNRRSIVYDPASGNYTLSLDDPRGGPNPLLFEISNQDIVAEKPDASRTWYGRDGEKAVSGYLFKPGAANPVLALTYTSFGDLTATGRHDGGAISRQYYLAYGIQTPPSLLPRSGSASYSGIARGTTSAAPGAYNGSLSGTSQLLADFAAGTAELSLRLTADNAERSPIGDFAISGTIANNGFFGNQNGVGGQEI